MFAGPAVERLKNVEVDEIAVTDSIPTPSAAKEIVTVLSTGPLLGDAIRRIHSSRSVSSLFLD